jgi:hypothetical protein
MYNIKYVKEKKNVRLHVSIFLTLISPPISFLFSINNYSFLAKLFIFLSGMQDGGYLYAKDLIDALKKKHAAKSYKKMVCFFECYCFVWMNRKINSSNRCIYYIVRENYFSDEY